MATETIYHSNSVRDIAGLNGTGRVAFDFNIGGPKRTRTLRLAIDPAFLKTIVETIAKTGCDEDSLGHAVWHLQNSHRPVPCETCKKR